MNIKEFAEKYNLDYSKVAFHIMKGDINVIKGKTKQEGDTIIFDENLQIFLERKQGTKPEGWLFLSELEQLTGISRAYLSKTPKVNRKRMWICGVQRYIYKNDHLVKQMIDNRKQTVPEGYITATECLHRYGIYKNFFRFNPKINKLVTMVKGKEITVYKDDEILVQEVKKYGDGSKTNYIRKARTKDLPEVITSMKQLVGNYYESRVDRTETPIMSKKTFYTDSRNRIVYGG